MQSSLFTNHITHLGLQGADIQYIDAFIDNQQHYFEALKNEIQWQQDIIQIAGKRVPIPRLNAWYGDVDAQYSYSGLTLNPKPWTDTLLELKATLENYLNESFNSVLVNYYRDGNDSVAWHCDNEPELGVNPLIASLSLGETRRFSLRGPVNADAKTFHIDLAGGSLLIMAGQTQTLWRHQLAKTKKPVGPRINLTFRQIVSK